MFVWGALQCKRNFEQGESDPFCSRTLTQAASLRILPYSTKSGKLQSEVQRDIRKTEKGDSVQEQSGVERTPYPGHESSMEEIAEFEIYDTKGHDSINKIGHFYLAKNRTFLFCLDN